jgi:hypothetical protein
MNSIEWEYKKEQKDNLWKDLNSSCCTFVNILLIRSVNLMGNRKILDKEIWRVFSNKRNGNREEKI